MAKNILKSEDSKTTIKNQNLSPEQLKKIIEKNQTPLVVNVACTRYPVVKKTMKKQFKMKLVTKKEDDKGAVRKGQGGLQLSSKYDLTWHDLPVTTEFFSKLLPYQKVNMYCGI